MINADLAAMFDAAHAEFAVLSPLLWDPLGAATVARSAPRLGDRVLDVCCGAGSSTVPAAAAVGPDGRVDAVDLSDRLLAQGRARATELGLGQLHFTRADATAWPGVPGGYDIVQCVFGVFFFPDMDAGAAHLVTLLRPGGRFTVTTWESSAIMPVPQILAEAVRQEGAGDPGTPRRPGDRIDNPAAFTDWLAGLGLTDVTVTEVPHRMPLDGDNAWALVMGSAMRRLVTDLPPDVARRVRARFTDLLAARGVDTLNATTLVGTGTTSAGPAVLTS